MIPESIKNFIAKMFYMGVKNYAEDSKEIELLIRILDSLDKKHQHLPLTDRVAICATLFIPSQDNEKISSWLEPHGISLIHSQGLEIQALHPAQVPIMECLTDMVGLGFLNLHTKTLQVYQEIAERQAFDILEAKRQDELSVFIHLLDFVNTNPDMKDYNISDHRLLQMWSLAVISQTNTRSTQNQNLDNIEAPINLVGHQIIWAPQFVESRCLFMLKDKFEVYPFKTRVTTLPLFATRLRILLILASEKDFWKNLFGQKSLLNYKEFSLLDPVGPQILLTTGKTCLKQNSIKEDIAVQNKFPIQDSPLKDLDKGICFPDNYQQVSYRDLQEGIPVFLQGTVDFNAGFFTGITGEKVALGLTHKKFLIENPNVSSYMGFGSLHYIEGDWLLTLAHMGYLVPYYGQVATSFLSEIKYHNQKQVSSLLDILRESSKDLSRKISN